MPNGRYIGVRGGVEEELDRKTIPVVFCCVLIGCLELGRREEWFIFRANNLVVIISA